MPKIAYFKKLASLTIGLCCAPHACAMQTSQETPIQGLLFKLPQDQNSSLQEPNYTLHAFRPPQARLSQLITTSKQQSTVTMLSLVLQNQNSPFEINKTQFDDFMQIDKNNDQDDQMDLESVTSDDMHE